MFSEDFTYDGKRLSDYNCIVCTFDSQNGVENIDSGTNLTFNTIARRRGAIHHLTSTKYDKCLTAQFDICKNPEMVENMYFTSSEIREIMKWLNRSDGFHLFSISPEFNEPEIYCNASFNIEKIVMSGNVCGFALKMETDRPFMWGAKLETMVNATSTDIAYGINNSSDDISIVYPVVEVTLGGDGNLEMTNTRTGEVTSINNCVSGEKITIDGEKMLLTTSNQDHKENLYDDFNYVFPALVNSIDNKVNPYTFSINCTAKISYYPVIKDVIA